MQKAGKGNEQMENRNQMKQLKVESVHLTPVG